MVVRDEHILGHESAGVVVAVHPSVTSLTVGRRQSRPRGRHSLLQVRDLSSRPLQWLRKCAVQVNASRPRIPAAVRPAGWCHKIGSMSL
ncbi:hypothetical protein V1517DRAFT_334656 [Lipomyces orientalis]|uniref:Uncharacterized protein n=1 Tax=Lipomyces orientalis TaxID=1233043 RepID=A0ACC3TDC0_9ASCO